MANFLIAALGNLRCVHDRISESDLFHNLIAVYGRFDCPMVVNADCRISQLILELEALPSVPVVAEKYSWVGRVGLLRAFHAKLSLSTAHSWLIGIILTDSQRFLVEILSDNLFPAAIRNALLTAT